MTKQQKTFSHHEARTLTLSSSIFTWINNINITSKIFSLQQRFATVLCCVVIVNKKTERVAKKMSPPPPPRLTMLNRNHYFSQSPMLNAAMLETAFDPCFVTRFDNGYHQIINCIRFIWIFSLAKFVSLISNKTLEIIH